MGLAKPNMNPFHAYMYLLGTHSNDLSIEVLLLFAILIKNKVTFLFHTLPKGSYHHPFCFPISVFKTICQRMGIVMDDEQEHKQKKRRK